MKISEQFKHLGNGLIERTTVETEIDTQIKYIPINKAFKSEINRAFADARLMICALSDKVRIEHDITLNGEYKLWETYRSNLYDSKRRLVVEDALCHRQEKRTGIRFFEMYNKIQNPKDKTDSMGYDVICAAGAMLNNEEGLLELRDNKKARLYIMGKQQSWERIKIESSADFLARVDMLRKTHGRLGGCSFAVLVSLGEEDSAALKYFKANPQALESILIGNCECAVENVKLKHTVSRSAITNDVVEEKYEFVFDNQPKEQNNG